MADEQSPELIQQRMAETRDSLTDKVAALESQVVGTIQNATTTVQDTVQSVKDTLQDTIDSVKETVGDVKNTVSESVTSVTDGMKETFDVSAQTRRAPWTVVGGATAAGFVTGLLVFRERALFAHGPHGSTPPMPAAAHPPVSHPTYAAGLHADAPRHAQADAGPGMMARLFGPLVDRAAEELKRVGEQAVEVAIASLNRNVKDGLPKLLDDAFAGLTGVRGGQTGRADGFRPNGAGTGTERSATY